MKKELRLLYSLIVYYNISIIKCFTITTVIKNDVSVTYKQLNNHNPYRFHIEGIRTKTDGKSLVACKMGLRSFIKKRLNKIKGNNNENDDNNNVNDDEEEEDYWDKLRKETLEDVKERKLSSIVSESEIQESSMSYGYDNEEYDDDANNDYEIYQGSESIEDRIVRIKSGGMTDDEKEAFLKTALDRTISSKGEYAGPPIRQQVVGNSNKGGSNSATTREKKEEGKPSPFPKDALWNSIASNKKISSYDDVVNVKVKGNDLLLEADEAKKREWYNMITNPDRFKGFSAYDRDDPSSSTLPSYTPPSTTKKQTTTTTNDAVFDLSIIDESTPPSQEQPQELPRASIDATDISSTASSSSTLSDRLEQAAILQTKLANEKREENERLRLKQEALYLEEQARIIAIRKQREEETLERERQLKAKKLAQQEAIKIQEEERKAKQLEQVRLLQLKQEEYWKQQLDKERQSQQSNMSTKEKQEYNMQQLKLKEQEQVRRQQEKQQMYEPKAESQVLDQAEINRERATELARQSLEASAAKVIQQEKQRTEMEQQKKQQQQQQQVANTKKKTPSTNIFDWGKLKNPTMPSSPSPTPAPAPAATTSRLNLNDLTRYKPTTTTTQSSSSPPPSTTPTQTNKPIRQTIGSMKAQSQQQQQPNKPIRMKLPIGNNEDDADTDVTTSEATKPNNENDEKKRASQWGINLDLLK